MFIELTSFALPWNVLRADLASGVTTLWDRVGGTFDARHSGVRVSMLYATSRDGTRVPMFVVEKGEASGTGPRPTVLYGYGGFNIAQTPAFSARTLLTVEHGVWVVALLRGGGEFGEEWHRAGMLDRKQNVFDDLYACAETLIAKGITRPEMLGLAGGSNGGLLVAAAITQRPELFRAGLCLVPLADMLRYHRFRIGALWTAEYGDPDDPAAFRWLQSYSPYHNVRQGTRYPAVLLTTAESDSRVDPMHARKMAAQLQEAQVASDRPVLLRVERAARATAPGSPWPSSSRSSPTRWPSSSTSSASISARHFASDFWTHVQYFGRVPLMSFDAMVLRAMLRLARRREAADEEAVAVRTGGSPAQVRSSLRRLRAMGLVQRVAHEPRLTMPGFAIAVALLPANAPRVARVRTARAA